MLVLVCVFVCVCVCQLFPHPYYLFPTLAPFSPSFPLSPPSSSFPCQRLQWPQPMSFACTYFCLLCPDHHTWSASTWPLALTSAQFRRVESARTHARRHVHTRIHPYAHMHAGMYIHTSISIRRGGVCHPKSTMMIKLITIARTLKVYMKTRGFPFKTFLTNKHAQVNKKTMALSHVLR